MQSRMVYTLIRAASNMHGCTSSLKLSQLPAKCPVLISLDVSLPRV